MALLINEHLPACKISYYYKPGKEVSKVDDLNRRYPHPERSPGRDYPIDFRDYGPEPLVINIEEAARQNNYFRLALWTGCYLQLTLMSIKVGEDIGLEMHPYVDQFIRIEHGQGLVLMGDHQCNLDFQRNVYDGYVILIPAGKWHNLINTGNVPLKLYSIYAPPEHPRGTVQVVKPAAENSDY
ncbi:MAG TPA: cupin domain-containing protein [Firmicutes bacterium]|nr:cupin domain-containing protein [Bacillota bacterium]